jgi:chromosome segregation ATPase
MNTIEALNITIQKLVKDKEKIDAKVQNYESKWLTALEELVANVSQRFSRAFQSIGNAGEVRIGKHEDYDKWGIEIMVKFRDNEQLQLLTATRQSGGERSISTITYLLSLTEMSRSPFSLVDEINQGMDQKYERQVHNHMVNVTCREGAGQ